MCFVMLRNRTRVCLQLVFAGAAKAGWYNPTTVVEHVDFGVVLGPDGKKFKTRDGNVVRLVDLMEEARQRMLASLQVCAWACAFLRMSSNQAPSSLCIVLVIDCRR